MWAFNLAIEFLPLAVFFVVNYSVGFLSGVAAMIVATLIATGTLYYRQRQISYFALLSLLFILVFGGGSLLFQNPDFFILQDTVKNAIFSAALFVSLYLKKPLLKTFFERSFAITDRGWFVLTMRWAVFFLLLAIGNEIIRMMYSEEIWVLYRGVTTIATFVFGIYQFTLSHRERIPEESNTLGLRTKSHEVVSETT